MKHVGAFCLGSFCQCLCQTLWTQMVVLKFICTDFPKRWFWKFRTLSSKIGYSEAADLQKLFVSSSQWLKPCETRAGLALHNTSRIISGTRPAVPKPLSSATLSTFRELVEGPHGVWQFYHGSSFGVDQPSRRFGRRNSLRQTANVRAVSRHGAKVERKSTNAQAQLWNERFRCTDALTGFPLRARAL